ncbi:MAG TPA: hypothetical protein VG148_15480 [Pyrinomonadaceae bacterium]|nr:hypothetical protein [Pyrinomonadaceae bacterium]
MKSGMIRACCLAPLLCFGAAGARAQEAAGGGVRPSEARVPMAQTAVALDVAGREALGGRLRSPQLSGTPDAPARNTRIVVENRTPLFYTYASGWATFYGEDGVRCGEGLWKLEALAPQEQVEVDTPGLRLTCQPATWRLVATTLLTRTGDVAKPPEGAPAPAETAAEDQAGETQAPAAGPTAALPPLEINVNGKTIPIQPGNPLEIVVGKERVRIVVQPAP